MSELAGTGIGVKLGASLLVMLSVFMVVGYTLTQVSTTEYAASVQVKDTSPWAVTVSSATVQATLTNGTKVFNATATGLPVTIQSGQTQTFSFSIFVLPGLGALPNSTQVLVVGHVDYSFGWVAPPAVSISRTFTVGQIRQALYVAGEIK
jgi:hypothetical protein